MARRATYIDGHRNGGSPILILDGGDLIDGPDTLSAIQGEFLFEAMSYMGYHAVGVGHRDLRRGVEWLHRTSKKWGIPVTSANLVIEETGETIFDPYVIIDVGAGSIAWVSFGGNRYAVISVMGTDKPVADTNPKLEITEPLEAVQKLLPRIREQVDMVIVLAQTTLEEAVAILELEGVDVAILARHDRMAARTAIATGGGILAGAYHSGHMVGWMDLRLDRESPRIHDSGQDFLGEDIRDEPTMGHLMVRYLQASAAFADTTAPEPIHFVPGKLRRVD